MPEYLNLENIGPLLLALAVVLAMRFIPRMLSKAELVDPAVLKARLDEDAEIMVLDVRSPREFTSGTGHVPGSLNLPLGQLGARLQSVAEELEELKHVPIYLICRTDNRALSAASKLHKAGFSDLKVVKGGIMRWGRQGFPVERG